MTFTDDDLIFSYSRKQAIADGVLIDVTEDARRAGFNIPVAVTSAVRALVEAIPKQSDDTVARRLRYLLLVLRRGITYASNVSEVDFDTLKFDVDLNTHETDSKETHQLKAVCGPGDDGEMVITIMMPNED